ncbi:uncharacterized protein METZ01_LOCUS294118, partial [marine metagenome]
HSKVRVEIAYCFIVKKLSTPIESIGSRSIVRIGL